MDPLAFASPRGAADLDTQLESRFGVGRGRGLRSITGSIPVSRTCVLAVQRVFSG
jgi:hypothetical protein